MNIDASEFMGKDLRIITQAGYIYIGRIISHGDDYFKFKDKYGKIVAISTSEIKIIEEIKLHG